MRSTWSVLTRTVIEYVRSCVCATVVVYAVHATTDTYMHRHTPHNVFVVSSVALHMVLYVGMTGLCALLPHIPCMNMYRLPRTPGQRPGRELVHATLWRALIAQCVKQPVVLSVVVWPLFAHTGAGHGGALPPVSTIFGQFMFTLACTECLFFWAHRALHTPKLYAAVHKVHHEYTGTIGIAAEYAHPVEHLVANQLPMLVGPLVCGVHLHVWLVWMTWRLWRVYESHSGYCFSDTWLGRVGLLHGSTSVFHDYHHRYPHRGCYGGSGTALWDHLCGTDTRFRRTLDH